MPPDVQADLKSRAHLNHKSSWHFVRVMVPSTAQA